MSKFMYFLARSIGREVSWGVGKAVRKSQRSSSYSALENSRQNPHSLPPSTEEMEYMSWVERLACRVKLLKSQRNKDAAWQMHMLVCAFYIVFNHYKEQFEGIVPSQKFVVFLPTVSLLMEEMINFVDAHLTKKELERLVASSPPGLQVNPETWELTQSS